MAADHTIGPIRFLWEAIPRWAALHPEREAVVDGKLRLSWRELDRHIRALAEVLRRAGVRPGDCVAQVSPPNAAFPIAFMAAARLGAFWAGFSPRYAPGELYAMLEDCAPAALIADLSEPCGISPATYHAIRNASDNLLLALTIGGPAESGDPDFWETVQGEDSAACADPADEQLDPDAPALLLYTSGSTGRPLGVLHSHRSILANVVHEARLFGIREDSRFLLHFPINHVAADVEIGYCTLYAGGTLVILPKFSPRDVMATVASEQVTVLGQVPAMYSMLFSDPEFSSTPFRSVKTFIYGGGVMSRELIRPLESLAGSVGAAIVTGYGLSEFAGFVSASLPGDTLFPGYAGRLYPDCEMRIADTSGTPLPDGEAGEILLRGPYRMLGYLNQPGITQARLNNDGWFRTGDIGVLKNGALEFRGRATEMFKSGGENIFPTEIEQVLETHPSVLAAAIVAVPDPTFGEVAHAFVVPQPGHSLSEDALRAYCAGRLAHFKVPRRFHFRDRLPMLSSGKVDRITLRSWHAEAAEEPAP